MSSREVGKSGSREESPVLSTAGAPRRLLVVKLADIGDALGTLPAVRALRATFPEARIDALVTPGPAREVFAREPTVNEVLTFAKGDFDAVRGMADPRD